MTDELWRQVPEIENHKIWKHSCDTLSCTLMSPILTKIDNYGYHLISVSEETMKNVTFTKG